MQRFVKTLRLSDDPAAIAAYRHAHDTIWPEIAQGIRDAGIASMELYLHGTLAVMVMELPDGADRDAVMERLAAFPRQQEWEEYVGTWQRCESGSTSAGKWRPMEKIFTLR